MKWFRTLPAIAAVAGLGMLYFVSHTYAGSPLPNTVAPSPVPATAQVTDANKLEHSAKLEREGKVVSMMGRKTMGKTIDLAGQKVKLPPDAWVDDYVNEIDCAPSLPCPNEVPFMVITRGNSRLYVTEHHGEVFRSDIKLGEEGLFSFMKGVVTR